MTTVMYPIAPLHLYQMKYRLFYQHKNNTLIVFTSEFIHHTPSSFSKRGEDIYIILKKRY